MGNSSLPRYSYPVHLLLIPAFRVLLGIPSSISHDAALLLRGAHPAPQVLNAENIPPASPFILTLNHYDRPGLAAWWGASTILCAIAARRAVAPRDLHLAIAREWWYPRGIGRAIKQPLTNWFFGQLAKAYGLIRLPPVLGDDRFRGEGALAIRRALALTRGNPPRLVGLAPEGHTGDNLSLCQPPAGAGLFLLMLAHETIPLLPAGIFEDDEKVLTVNFGAPFQLSDSRSLSRSERDAHAAQQVMVEIGKRLPERMWGAYREDIRKT